MKNTLLLSFYGDDFTGSTDAMEALSLAGVRTALFLEPPEKLSGEFEGLQAIGVAGVSRTMNPRQMDEILPKVFERIKRLGAPLFHYKVCSTFDSSPETGSIGRAIDIGTKTFASSQSSSFVPLLVGAPVLKRYTLFGNLFATVGNETFRLDRHPTMSRHPVTPMHESDLRWHLSQQTAKKIALLDILRLSGTVDEVNQNLARVLESSPDVVLFDVLDAARLAQAGRLIWEQCNKEEPLFVVGSSGVEYALTQHWQAEGELPKTQFKISSGAAAAAAEQLLVISGSCSPVTERQITWALENGFAGIALDAVRLADPDQAAAELARVAHHARQHLEQGANLVLYSALGPADPKLESTFSELHECGIDQRRAGELLGEQQGKILRLLLEETGLRRVVVAGGDTSGCVMRQLGIYALEMIAPIAPGSPLCRAYSHQASLNGLEVALKGGQVGREDYFERVRQGSA